MFDPLNFQAACFTEFTSDFELVLASWYCQKLGSWEKHEEREIAVLWSCCGGKLKRKEPISFGQNEKIIHESS